jgi:hypothetical protein
VIAKATFDAFVNSFPVSKAKFDAKFKKEVYTRVLELFVGSLFTFDFHIQMLKKLFGDTEVRDLIR